MSPSATRFNAFFFQVEAALQRFVANEPMEKPQPDEDNIQWVQVACHPAASAVVALMQTRLFGCIFFCGWNDLV